MFLLLGESVKHLKSYLDFFSNYIVRTKKIILLCIVLFVTLSIWVLPSMKNINVLPKYSLLTSNKNNNYTREIIIDPDKSICSDELLMIILVTSYVGHVELRSVHRKTMPDDYLKTFNTQRIFLISKIPLSEKNITQQAINEESEEFGDLLQGDFYEHYRNLTYKHLMGLNWASAHCQKAKYILKVDDDTVFNLRSTYDYLKQLEPKDSLVGYILDKNGPERGRDNKWYVSINEYEGILYPPYLSGWYYITTALAASRLVAEAEHHRFFWIDDVFITGIVAKAANIELEPLPKGFWMDSYELLECCMKDMVLKNITCGHVVGTNGGRNNLMFEFNKAIHNCKVKKCIKRVKSLNKHCISLRERYLFSSGQGFVELL